MVWRRQRAAIARRRATAVATDQGRPSPPTQRCCRVLLCHRLTLRVELCMRRCGLASSRSSSSSRRARAATPRRFRGRLRICTRSRMCFKTSGLIRITFFSACRHVLAGELGRGSVNEFVMAPVGREYEWKDEGLLPLWEWQGDSPATTPLTDSEGVLVDGKCHMKEVSKGARVRTRNSLCAHVPVHPSR